ncbi:MAG: permease-like cell division protein FtsX [Clostridiales Family XIII bacterium]|jgi:cell division transport system permease protein|nr:permease-like cell division protein FtsX [Clostridiales Family XIII bacterium]
MNTRVITALRQALRQIGRNLTMTMTSLFSITAILLILGFFFIIIVNINFMTQGIRDSFDTVQVNLLETTTQEQAQTMIADLKKQSNVASVVYQTKDDALAHWKEQWGDQADILDRLPSNPLPNSIIVTVKNIEKVDKIVTYAEAMPGVEKITYSKDTVNKLIRITNIIQIVALVLIIFLLFISIIVVSNTIKLTVMARGREIMIMKYVGATNWYIRGPFLFEGIILGLLGALISGVLVLVIYHLIVSKYGVNVVMIMSSGLISESTMLENLTAIFAALGISIGACGSIISMRRFLDT